MRVLVDRIGELRGGVTPVSEDVVDPRPKVTRYRRRFGSRSGQSLTCGWRLNARGTANWISWAIHSGSPLPWQLPQIASGSLP